MVWSREKYIDLMTFEKCERQLFVELFGLLVGLDSEWRAQGASEDEISLSAFCFDSVNMYSVGANGFIDYFPEETLEEDDEKRIFRDFLGRVSKLLKKSATIPLPLEYPVKSRDDWLKFKPKLSFDERRVDYGEIEKAKKLQREGWLINVSIFGGFSTARELMGDEAACVAYYDDPELMKDIIQTMSDCAHETISRITDKMTVDHIAVHEDMAGKSGPLVGPALVKEFISPYYRRIWDLASSRGAKLFSQDSDGNMNALMETFIEAGVNVFHPMEPAAGMDIVELRKKFGKRAAFKGGIDKHVLRKNKEDIKRELEYKLQPLMREGGTVFGLDHRIPNGTPIENYKYYIETAREILGLEPIDEARKCWTRMAF